MFIVLERNKSILIDRTNFIRNLGIGKGITRVIHIENGERKDADLYLITLFINVVRGSRKVGTC